MQDGGPESATRTPGTDPAAGAAEPVTTPGWEPDVLPGFEQRTLRLAPDFEGEVDTTLVRPVPPAPDEAARPDVGVDLLYVHGWTDYFFQTHLADFWERLGVRFHALDLRKYGRSLRPHHTPGFVTRLETYDEDLEAALATIGHGRDDRADRRLVLMGHSTGGLILSLWAAHHPGRAAALVLNSPWLEFQTRKVGRRVLEPGVRAHAALAPRSHLVNVDQGFYVRSISRRYEGAWDVDPAWRPDDGWRATPAWLSAIFDGHEEVALGLDLDVPVLVMLSTRTVRPVRWSPEMLRADTVLDVEGIAERAARLGRLVTIARIEGALHDVTLSAPDVRAVVRQETERWFRAYVPTRPPAPEPAPEAPWWRRLFGPARERSVGSDA
ncbi:alpha/beta hydrolase [Isoptericola sp. 178]|uniref:alpha/beta hydrolase n=1 Tax=Isoptericola sp. 178 TaxID=3064651 RepID=UPI0027127AFA|nr:alpha/beta hydrolase [Isoptericola sp. 178]MDO8143709.1 alpha/beta hydrolase [Isoptericola sp. 178]